MKPNDVFHLEKIDITSAPTIVVNNRSTSPFSFTRHVHFMTRTRNMKAFIGSTMEETRGR